MKSKALTSLLGLSFENGYLEAVLLRRTVRQVQVRRTLRAALSLDPMRNEPELVGREIRGILLDAGINESRCVVCVPLSWVLTLRTDLPNLSKEDVASYLNLQAEREFPFAPEDLFIAVSQFTTPSGRKEALLAAIPRHHLNALLATLRAAKLRPVEVTAGIASLASANASSAEGAVAVLMNENRADLAMSFGRSIVALRSLEEATDPNEAGFDARAGFIARQIRITLGQLAPEVRSAVRSIRFFGSPDGVQHVLSEMSDHAKSLGISVERGGGDAGLAWPEPDMLAKVSPGVVAATTQRIAGHAAPLDFLPPRISRLKQITGRVSSRVAYWGACAAALLVIGIGSPYLAQYWRLSKLASQWKAIEPRVKEVTAVQENIRRFRGWFDDSASNLIIARRLTEAFPEDGAVWAKSLEIHHTADSDLPTVSCSGKARSNRDWLRMLERLRETKGVKDLRFAQITGTNPLQFTMTFRWSEGEADGL